MMQPARWAMVGYAVGHLLLLPFVSMNGGGESDLLLAFVIHHRVSLV